MVVTNEESNERGVLFMALGRKTERDNKKDERKKQKNKKGDKGAAAATKWGLGGLGLVTVPF